MVNIVKDDLFEFARFGNLDAIVHGCNCFCRMKSGIAKSIARIFPENVKIDEKTIVGDRSKLGTYTLVKYKISESDPVMEMLTDSNYPKFNYELHVINAYTQFDMGHDGKLYFNYDAFTTICKKLNEEYKDKRIGMPWIGCGLAGGDKEKVLKILEDTMTKCDCTICEL